MIHALARVATGRIHLPVAESKESMKPMSHHPIDRRNILRTMAALAVTSAAWMTPANVIAAERPVSDVDHSDDHSPTDSSPAATEPIPPQPVNYEDGRLSNGIVSVSFAEDGTFSCFRSAASSPA